MKVRNETGVLCGNMRNGIVALKIDYYFRLCYSFYKTWFRSGKDFHTYTYIFTSTMSTHTG